MTGAPKSRGEVQSCSPVLASGPSDDTRTLNGDALETTGPFTCGPPGISMLSEYPIARKNSLVPSGENMKFAVAPADMFCGDRIGWLSVS